MSEILVQVIPQQSNGGYLAPPAAVGPEVFAARAPDIAAGVATVANAIRKDLEAQLETSPAGRFHLQDIELKFTLDLEAEAGVIIAKTKAAAGFEVTLTWHRGS